MNGEELADLVTNRDLAEYDIGPMEGSELFRVEQDRYLLVNKLLLKNLYFEWRSAFLLHHNVDQDKLSKLILLVNPNFLSAWSRRKQQIKNINYSQSESAFRDELKLCTLILTKHVKCEQAYVHRRWLLRTFSAFCDEQLIRDEIKLIVERLSVKVKANYYCWTYFNWLLQFLGRDSLVEFSKPSGFVNVLFMNPSDNCVFHSRLQLIKSIVQTGSIQQLLVDEFKLIDELIVRFPNYSTVWNYSKYFLIFVRQEQLIQKCSLTIDILSAVLNESLKKNIGLVFFKLNESEVNSLLDFDITGLLDTFDYLVKRQLFISKILLKLLTSDNEFSNIESLQRSFTCFIEKFLINPKNSTK